VTLETYRQTKRYIVMTSNPLPGTPAEITDIDTCIDEIVAELEAQKKKRDEPNKPGTPDDGGHHARQEQDDEDELDHTIRDGGGTRHGPTRSEAMWWVVHEMMRRGYALPAIEAVLLDHKNGISQHIYEQPEPRRYVKRQVAEAKKKIALASTEDGKPYASANNIRIAMLKMGITPRYDSLLIASTSRASPALVRYWMTPRCCGCG